MSTIYSAPEKYGLTIVGEVDFGGPKEFDKCVVWRDQDGEFWYAWDSGCSCPTPFEDYSITHPTWDLTKLHSLAFLKQQLEAEAYDHEDTYPAGMQAVVALIERLREAGVR